MRRRLPPVVEVVDFERPPLVPSKWGHLSVVPDWTPSAVEEALSDLQTAADEYAALVAVIGVEDLRSLAVRGELARRLDVAKDRHEALLDAVANG